MPAVDSERLKSTQKERKQRPGKGVWTLLKGFGLPESETLSNSTADVI